MRYEEANAKQELMVTEEIVRAHPVHTDYPLLPEDLVTRHQDGTWYKYAPGMGVTGFVLTPEQVQTLKPVWVNSMHLYYNVVGDVDAGEVSPEITAMLEGTHAYDL